MEVGKRITELRERAGITTNKLANLSGLSQSFVRSVELGEKSITVENLGLICDVLQVSLRDFFDEGDKVRICEAGEELEHLINGLSAAQKQAMIALIESFRI